MIKRAFEWLGGSVVVYVLVAACAGAGGDDSGEKAVATGDGGSQPGVNGEGGTKPGVGGKGGILDPVPDADAAEDGDRIKIVYQTTTGGLKIPAGNVFFDEELDVECNFQVAEDGKTRCLPALAIGSVNRSFYSDSGCTRPVLIATKDSCSPTQATESVLIPDNETCALPVNGAARYTVGAKVTSVLYQGTPASCTDASSIFDSFDVYELGDPINPKTFAEATPLCQESCRLS